MPESFHYRVFFTEFSLTSSLNQVYSTEFVLPSFLYRIFYTDLSLPSFLYRVSSTKFSLPKSSLSSLNQIFFTEFALPSFLYRVLCACVWGSFIESEPSFPPQSASFLFSSVFTEFFCCCCCSTLDRRLFPKREASLTSPDGRCCDGDGAFSFVDSFVCSFFWPKHQKSEEKQKKDENVETKTSLFQRAGYRVVVSFFFLSFPFSHIQNGSCSLCPIRLRFGKKNDDPTIKSWTAMKARY